MAKQTFEPADMAFVLFCTFGVFLITPAVAMFYAGTLRRKNLVQLLFQSYMVTCVVVMVWYLLGYSLANSALLLLLLGNLAHGALHNEKARPLAPGGTIPSVINFGFNVFFPVATNQIFLGAIGERGRVLPSLVIAAVWTIVCYCPFAYWVWLLEGWLSKLGALDFAGGGPVHIASGVASFVYLWYLGPREASGHTSRHLVRYQGHSALTTFVGVTLIWAAWFCFNSGTLLLVNVRTGYIFLNTILALSFACFTYAAVDRVVTGRFSLQAACEGAVVGLVNITPLCGFYWPWAAAVTSIINGAMCRMLAGLNKWTGVDDYSVSGVVHGIGGIIGATLTGIFATKTVAGYDGATEIDGGWIDGNFVQLGYQIAGWVSITAWTAVFTLIILVLVDHIPGLRLRALAEAEDMGMDMYEMAETANEFTQEFGMDPHDFLKQNAAKLRLLLARFDESVEVIEGISRDETHVNTVSEKV